MKCYICQNLDEGHHGPKLRPSKKKVFKKKVEIVKKKKKNCSTIALMCSDVYNTTLARTPQPQAHKKQ